MKIFVQTFEGESLKSLENTINKYISENGDIVSVISFSISTHVKGNDTFYIGALTFQFS